MKAGLVLGIVIAVIVLVAGIFIFSGGDKTQTATGSGSMNNENQNGAGIPEDASSGQTYSIDITHFAFNPQTLTIKVGDTVVWTNQDDAPHTVTSDSGSELNSGTLNKGITFSHTFNSAGSYDYHCKFHGMMTAKIIVN